MDGGNLSCYFPLHYWQYISNSRRNVPQRRKFRLHKTRRSSPRARDQIIIVPNCPLNWHCKYIMRICHNSAEQQLVRTSPPENTRRWPCAGLKLGCRRRRRDQAEPIIGPTGREKPWCLVLSASSLSLSCLWKFNPLSDNLFNLIFHLCTWNCVALTRFTTLSGWTLFRLDKMNVNDFEILLIDVTFWA